MNQNHINIEHGGQNSLKLSHLDIPLPPPYSRILYLTHPCIYMVECINLWSRVIHLLEMGWLASSMENLIGHYSQCSHCSAPFGRQRWSCTWCTGMYWGALGSAQQTLLACTEVNWAGGLGVLGSACMCWHVLECTGVCLYVLACTEVYWDVLGCTGVYLVYLGKLGVLGDIGQIMSWAGW